MFIERYLTKDTLYHFLIALPAILLLVLFGTSLNDQWWFFGVLYWIAVFSLVLNVAGIALAPLNQYAALYSIIKMFCFLLFIPVFCSLVLTVFFGLMLIFGIDFNPNTLP